MCKKYSDEVKTMNVLEQAEKLNPGLWKPHSEFVALACRNIAEHCSNIDSDKAYILG